MPSSSPKPSGRLPGLKGTLNPIRDSLDRTYLYAFNIAINQGEPQPVSFVPGEVMLACAGGILCYGGVLKRSRTLCLMAIALAYYSAAISPIGWLAMFSNLLLTATGVTMLVKFRWPSLGFVTLVGTYGAFAFWQYFYPEFGAVGQPLDFWSTQIYLIGYWALFSAATLIPNYEQWPMPRRTLFSGLNNGAFFGLFSLGMLLNQEEHFWVFSLCLGGALLAQSVFSARRFKAAGALMTNAFLVKALLLITLGFVGFSNRWG